MAQILGRSEQTVKDQMRDLYGKLGAASRVQALQRAVRLASREYVYDTNVLFQVVYGSMQAQPLEPQ